MKTVVLPGFVLFSILYSLPPVLHAQERGAPWTRHTIDDSSRGADGVRLADANGDGLPDIVTGWEEGGVIRLYLHPGHTRATEKWPAVTVGQVRSPEDAVFVDLDGDGALDVVSSCEGKVQSLFVHWAPKDKGKYLDSAAWQTKAIPVSQGKTRWMFCVPVQVDGKNGVDLIVGSKKPNARIAWLEAPANARDLDAWTCHKIYDADWIMSIRAVDMDGDGDLDVLTSDRKGEGRGARWLENPGPGPVQSQPWRDHLISSAGRQIMFLTVADLDGDALADVVTAVKPKQVVFSRRKGADGTSWEDHAFSLPENTGTSKGVAVGDIDKDGKPDVVASCEHASKGTSGVFWMSYAESPTDPAWRAHEISGPEGVKFDRIELLDLDGDGDLDVLTCEERDNLGVFWYENPTVLALGFPLPAREEE